MLPVRWRASAVDDLDEIIDYIAARNPSAARTLRDRIESCVLPLSTFPYMFRQGRIPGTRELVAHPNYVLVYRVLHDAVEIVSVMHSARKYP